MYRGMLVVAVVVTVAVGMLATSTVTVAPDAAGGRPPIIGTVAVASSTP